MAITKSTARQWPLVAVVDIGYADIVADGTFEAVDLPGTARVIGGALIVTEVWDNTTATIGVGDATTAARYLAATSVKALGTTEFDFTAESGLAIEDVTIAFVETGGPAATGAAKLYVEYVLDGKSNEVQPTQD